MGDRGTEEEGLPRPLSVSPELCFHRTDVDGAAACLTAHVASRPQTPGLPIHGRCGATGERGPSSTPPASCGTESREGGRRAAEPSGHRAQEAWGLTCPTPAAALLPRGGLHAGTGSASVALPLLRWGRPSHSAVLFTGT